MSNIVTHFFFISINFYHLYYYDCMLCLLNYIYSPTKYISVNLASTTHTMALINGKFTRDEIYGYRN